MVKRSDTLATTCGQEQAAERPREEEEGKTLVRRNGNDREMR